MSLTSILKDKRRQNLRDWLKENFPGKALKIKKGILVASNGNSSYSAEIGTAFDYLFRFTLERLNKRMIFKRQSWVAENGLNNIHRRLKNRNDKFLTFLYDGFNKAKINYEAYIEKGDLTDDLIKSAIFLAKLDVSSRTVFIDENFESDDAEKVNELRKIMESVCWKNFIAQKYCILNPVFGGSGSVIEADADVVMDGCLIDIKTNKELKIKREDLNQLIGYYFLSLAGGVKISNADETSFAKIKKIGIYFARYDYLWQMSLDEFCNEEKILELKDEFFDLINKREKLILFHAPKSQALYELTEDDFKCIYCGSKEITKAGKPRDKFRYKCKACNKSFSSAIKKKEMGLEDIVL